MPHSNRIVCFDIGGVLVKIRHTWDQAVRAVAVDSGAVPNQPLNAFPGLLDYQEGNLTDEAYLENLGSWLGLARDHAASVHRAILDVDYPGAERLVEDLKSGGVFTCCFSNTNALHWRFLTDPESHPAVASLDLKLASHEVLAAKPELAAYDKVDKLFPPHQRVIFFDDTLENVNAARKYGWTSFHIDAMADPVVQMRETLKKLEILD